MGSSKPISLSNENSDLASVWKLENVADELIDDDDLLDEEDLRKPDPSTLRGEIVATFGLPADGAKMYKLSEFCESLLEDYVSVIRST